jgi:homoserine O-acetyltransferase/O-succinyltransferase
MTETSPLREAALGGLDLELGASLPELQVAYRTWGQLDARRSNAVLVLHALTGDSNVPGWWPGLVGPGKALDTDRWFVVAANVLGGCSGTTGPSSLAPDGAPWGSRFPVTTIRDQVAAEVRLADHLGIDRFAAVVGGSMGGMRALEWLVSYPDRVGAGLVLAVGAEATADQLGTQTTQLFAIKSDPGWHGGDYHLVGDGRGPVTGLALARRIAHLTYRSEGELAFRFGRQAQPGEDPLRGGRFAVESYLEHHGNKLVNRFDAGTYVALTEAMNTHDVGRGRGGTEAALAEIRSPVVVAGVDSDRLYPLRLQEELAALIPTVDKLEVVTSDYGHDGFLLEIETVGALVRRTLDLAT